MKKFHQHYPTYTYNPKHRDVVLKEFENAQQISNSQTKFFSQVSGLLFGFSGIIFERTLSFFKEDSIVTLDRLSPIYSIIMAIIFILLSYLLLTYFIELWKTIILNRRKVIVLRKMLDLDYGALQLVLPRWRVEGATNPFAIKLFPGWISDGSFPFWTIAVSTSIVFYALSSNIINLIPMAYFSRISGIFFSFMPLEFIQWISSLTVFTFLAYTFRKKLLDTHERMDLEIIKCLFSVLRLGLVDNFEYIIYRAKLAVNETQRLEISIPNVREMLVAIEDRRFNSHSGVDFRAMVRGFLSNLEYFRHKGGYLRSGGSTITMQLTRSLFIKAIDYKKVLRRKLAEVLLSLFWLDRVFTKKEILNIYLSSVRFENGINGIKAASDHFFGEYNKKSFSEEEAFFLIERLSCKGAIYFEKKIKFLIKRINQDSTIRLDSKNVLNLYKHVEGLGKVKCKM
ncbi:MAG: transglycosylase domain-containing protein [Parcubacteria group bacterium]|nr:transglycosylase domain-containing protein [Parcubacteria group bacterium]